MAKLKIVSIDAAKPVTLTVKLSAGVHRDLVAYADAIKRESGQHVDPGLLIPAMLERFMVTDRAFAKARRMTRTRQDKDG